MKWYIFYAVLISTALYVGFVYPRIVSTLLTLNAWVYQKQNNCNNTAHFVYAWVTHVRVGVHGVVWFVL